MIVDPRPFFPNGWTKVLAHKEWKCWLETRMRITAGCSSQLDLAFVLSKQNWHCVGGWRWWWGSCYFNCGCCRIWFNTLIIIAHCCSRSTPFYLLFWQNFQTKRRWNHLVLKMEILIDQNQGCYIIPNMFCTVVQILHHDLVPFSALQVNDLLLWSVGMNLYHNKAHISKLSGF